MLHRVLEKKRKESKGEATPDDQDDSGNVEPTQEELDAIEPKIMPKDKAHYEAKIQMTQKKMENERARRNMSNEDPNVAREKYERAFEDTGTFCTTVPCISDTF